MKTTLDVGYHHLPPFHQPHLPFQFVKRPFQFWPLHARPFQFRPLHARPFHVRPPRKPIPGRPTIPWRPIIPERPAIRPCPPPRPCGAAVANGATVKATRHPKESISFELFTLNGFLIITYRTLRKVAFFTAATE